MSWTTNTPRGKNGPSAIASFAAEHRVQILAIIGLLTFAATKKKLTALGLVTAGISASIHMLNPFGVFFWLLGAFFLLGVLVTKVGHAAKAHLTKSSTGASTSEGTRGAVQVIANSGCAALLILLHTYLAASTPFIALRTGIGAGPYFPTLQGVLPLGIIAQYTAVAADTFGSELGILAKSQPFLITAPWKRVSKGTNGGVTIEGILYGALASAIMTGIAAAGLHALPPHRTMSTSAALLLFGMGIAGSLIDSVLGATVQATVTERVSGKVVEGPGGQRVKVNEGGSRVRSGNDILTNNGVNLAMAVITSALTMAIASTLGIYIA